MRKRLLSRGLLVVTALASAVGLSACTHRGWDGEMAFVVAENPPDKYAPVRLVPADDARPEGMFKADFGWDFANPEELPTGVRKGDRLVCAVRQEYQVIAQDPDNASTIITNCRRA